MFKKISEKLWQYIAKKTHYYHLWRTPPIHGQNKLILGESVILNNAIINTRSGNITIGDFTFFGHNVMLLTGIHDYTKRGLERIQTVPKEGHDIVISKGVWIGSGVIILGGVKIGENSVIGSGSVVTGDIPDNVFVAGNPAVVIKGI